MNLAVAAGDSYIEKIRQILDGQSSLLAAYPELEPIILDVMQAERMSLFHRRRHYQDLVSHMKTGREMKEIRVPINLQSIAGYVAFSKLPIKLNSPYDKQELAAIHPRLRFADHIDKQSNYITRNILSVPIVDGDVVLGVLEIVNKRDNDFSEADLSLAQHIALLLGRKYRFDIGGTSQAFDYLVFRNKLSRDDLNEVMSDYPDEERQITMLQLHYGIADTEIGNALSVYHQVPFIPFSPDDYVVSKLQEKLSNSYAMRHKVVVITDNTEVPVLLMADPSNASLLMEIENVLGVGHCEISVGLPEHIISYLEQSQIGVSSQNLDSLVEEINANRITKKAEHVVQQVKEDEPAIVRLVDKLLVDAYKQGASDIHIDPEKDKPTLIRFRIDGECRDVSEVAEYQHNAIVARIKILSSLNIAEKRIPQDGKLAFMVSGKKVEVRVATVPTVTGEGVVMRILASSGAMPMSKLNLAGSVSSRLREIISKPHGIFLVVGPTGSGKTTTLHAILGQLNKPGTKIWTAEDPVEITQHRLQQVQVSPKIGFTFEAALRAFLRADPDIILVGEMRDRETAHIAVEASLTGHLVLSTLHTNSAPETITRLLDMGLDPINFADACLGVLAQRLIKTLCKHCKKPRNLTQDDMDFIRQYYGEESINDFDLDESTDVYEAVGCGYCDETGYKGRTGIHELLSMTSELKALVIKGEPLEKMVAQARKDGMKTLLQDSIYKFIKGDTDIKQVRLLHGIVD